MTGWLVPFFAGQDERRRGLWLMASPSFAVRVRSRVRRYCAVLLYHCTISTRLIPKCNPCLACDLVTPAECTLVQSVLYCTPHHVLRKNQSTNLRPIGCDQAFDCLT
jgi:hypothetical protein